MGVLYINNTKIDTSEDVVFPITYSIADIKNPNTRQRNRTKTIVLPDTLTNRKFFSSAYQISLSDLDNTGVGFEFDHNLKYPARYVSKGVDIFIGVANLLQASIDNGVLSVEVNLFSEIVNMFDTWGDLKVNELGWSEYDHVLNKTNIEDSWTNTDTSGYVYGLIYFGYNSDQLTYKTNDLVPYVFQREIIKKALEFLGLGLASTTLNDPDFKRRVWGYGGGEKISITTAQVTDRYVFIDSDFAGNTEVSFSPVSGMDDGSNRTTTFNSTIQYDIDANIINIFNLNNNILNQADLANSDWIGSWTVANKGFYRLSFDGSVDLTAVWSYANPSAYTANLNFYWTFIIMVNGITVSSQIIDSIANTANVNLSTAVAVEVDSLLNAGDVVSFGYKMEVKNSDIITPNVPQSDLDSSTIDMDLIPVTVFDFKMEAIDKELQDGETVNIARWMPDTKVSEFFADLIITENLYISEPKDGQIKMESFNNYYDGTSDDWTDKIDLSKKIIFEPPRLEGKDYIWKFAEDRDFFKQDYFNEYGLDYGDYKLTIAGSYKQGEKVWQTKFAQSVPVDIAPNNTGELIVPVIAKSEDNGASFQPYKGKPRVFYYNGMQTCYPWSFRDSLNGTITSEVEYPQFHHLDDVDTPTFDYNFGKPDKVYYTATDYTLKNLIQINYFTFIKSVLSRSSKIMKAYFNLNEEDLYNNFMKNYATVDCVRFIKNIVTDFNDNSLDTTLVELFKVVDARTANTSQTDNGGGGVATYSNLQTYSDGLGVSYNEDLAQMIPAGNTVKITNNEDTKEGDFMPETVTSIYDKDVDEFDFSGLAIGSTVQISIMAQIVAVAETELTGYLKINDEAATGNKIPLIFSQSRFVGTGDISISATVIVSEKAKENTISVFIKSSLACTVQVSNYQYIIKSINTWKQ